LHVIDDNERAITCYRRCGFVEEGRLRDSIEIAGRWHDDIVMAILADDFEAPGHPLP
jgi:[ribosomal protein S5]-alanine N-acetyltransferase